MPPATLVSAALFGLVLLGAGLILMTVLLMRRSSGSTARVRRREAGTEIALLSAALQEAVAKLKAQERATAARAEASERRAEQIVDELPSGLLVVNRDGKLETINPAARRILDISQPVAGLPSRHVLSEASGLADLIDEALTSARAIARRTVTIGPALQRSHLGVSVSPMAHADGAVGAVVCLFTDLTAVVELEEQLRLKEALARLGELTAGLAHEFRNGLATIHGYGRLLDPSTLPESQRACVEGIRHETVALGEVVTNFLRFAKPDPLVLQPVDLRSVIARSIEDVPGAPASATIEGAFGEVQGDEVLLRQAFSNLVRNGLEACAMTGVTPRVVLSGSVEGGHVHVTVDDNGPGLPSESIDKVFQPFVTTKSNGTGLGLAIVQKVIVSHNGRVWAANRPGGGAEFTIKLPVAEKQVDGIRQTVKPTVAGTA
jgi:nitrogen fixation/metabolism regulation signal transduction histidine kinase